MAVVVHVQLVNERQELCLSVLAQIEMPCISPFHTDVDKTCFELHPQTLRKLYEDTLQEMGTTVGTPPASTPKQPRKVRTHAHAGGMPLKHVNRDESVLPCTLRINAHCTAATTAWISLAMIDHYL